MTNSTSLKQSPKSLALVAVRVSEHIHFRQPLIKELVKQGIKVYVLAADFDEGSRRIIRALGGQPEDISMTRTGINPVADILSMLSLARTFKRIRPDVVMCSFIKPVIFGTLAARLARVEKRIAMIEGLGYVYTDLKNAPSIKKRTLRLVVSALYRFALFYSDQTIFLNEDDRDEFIQRRLVKPRKSLVLGGIGVDLAQWPLIPPVTNPIRFLFIGRLLREKGIEEFVVAAKLLRTRSPDCEFVILGGVDCNPGGIDADQMERWVADGVIIWPGHVSDVASWISLSSVFVLPSYREGLPRSAQEAMAMGRPIITTDVPGCRETVQDGSNGYLVPAGDAAALAQAMLRFVEKPDLLEEMGQVSRTIAEERFDVHKVNDRLINIIRH